MKTTKPTVKNKPPVKKIAWLTVLGIIALAFLTGWLWPDGTEKYRDAEKEAGKAALYHVRTSGDAIDSFKILGTLKFRVEKIEPYPSTGPSRGCHYDFEGSGLPQSADRFKVWVGTSTIFGLKLYDLYEGRPVVICRYER